MRLIDADLLGLTDMEIIMCDGDYKEALKMLIDKIEHAPTIEPEQRWVSCSERLPEGIGQVIIQSNGGAINEAFYKGKNNLGHEVWIRLDGCIYWDDEVIAWMPLPSPYKEKE